MTKKNLNFVRFFLCVSMTTLLLLGTTGCGPSKEIKDALDKIIIENNLPELEIPDTISVEEAQKHIKALQDAFGEIVSEIETKYDYKEYIRNLENPSRVLEGEMKGIYAEYKKRMDKALEAAEDDFEKAVKEIISKISDFSETQKDELWKAVYDESIAPLKDYLANLGQ
ncbi:MAG: hypothetical protein WBH44_11970 [Proteocatella sp.]